MKTSIYSHNFETSPHHEDFIESCLAEKITEQLEHEVISVKVWLKIENSFLKRGKDAYLCEIKIKTKSFGTIFTKEVQSDFYDSIKIATSEIVTILKKKHDRKKDRSRRIKIQFRKLIGFGNSTQT